MVLEIGGGACAWGPSVFRPQSWRLAIRPLLLVRVGVDCLDQYTRSASSYQAVRKYARKHILAYARMLGEW